jgi:hypothetical protein
MADALSRHGLYELCVQSPGDVVAFLGAVHGHKPTILGEDFCGTAAVSRAWVRGIAGGRAVAIDADADVLAEARRRAVAPGIEFMLGDVLATTDPEPRAADVIFVGNFSIGEIHERSRLIAYLGHSRSRLGASGIFVCDVYGGESAFATGDVQRIHVAPGGARVRYTWEQRAADPTTGMVVCAMHFRVERAGRVLAEHRDAFVYRWRLWSVPELRDAMLDAGFARSEVSAKLADAKDQDGHVYVRPVTASGALDESFVVFVVGRV